MRKSRGRKKLSEGDLALERASGGTRRIPGILLRARNSGRVRYIPVVLYCINRNELTPPSPAEREGMTGWGEGCGLGVSLGVSPSDTEVCVGLFWLYAIQAVDSNFCVFFFFYRFVKIS